MTDGMCFYHLPATGDLGGVVNPETKLEIKGLENEPTIDLTTLAGILEETARELYRLHWPTYGAECQQLAKNIRMAIRFHEGHKET